MPLDLNKIKSRLESLKSTGTKSNAVWKPKGKSVIRIVPYSHNPENPFIELLFHYNMNGKTYLSPASFGRPDPIIELANKLKKSGDKEQWTQGRTLEPKMRTYVPILVRGQEQEGVKFWGMGKQVYQEILGIIADPDYGDITDVRTGRDIAVEFKTAEETGKSFPETTIRVKPSQTPAFDPNDKVVLEKVKHQKNLTEVFPELTYEELAAAVEQWLNGGAAENEQDPTPTPTTDEVPTTSEGVAAPTTVSATQKTKSPAPTKSAKDVADEFSDLFNS